MHTKTTRSTAKADAPYHWNLNRLALAVLFFFIATTAWGQIKTLPDGGRLLGYAASETPGVWAVFASGFLEVKPTVIDGGKAIVWQGPPGEYGVVFFTDLTSPAVITRVVLGGDVTPVPPPKPDPPTPTPGERWAVIWEETSQRTPAQAALYVQLRAAFKPDKLFILDQSSLPPAWKAIYDQVTAGQTLPALTVLAGNKVVRTVPVPPSVDAVEQEVAR
jgi:hypothetical protein